MENTMALGNKPLVEAIFEIRWELIGGFGPLGPADPLYDVMIGALFGKLRADFPQHVRLPSAQVPGMMMPHQVQHQFRAGELGWPLVQLGSGVLTVNETAGYSSQTFIPLCLKVFNALNEFWQENNHRPRIINTSLRYVDAEILNGAPVEEFLGKLDVVYRLGDRIRNTPNFDPLAEAFQLHTRMKSAAPEGFVSFSFTRGLKEGQDSLIWETAIASEGTQCDPFVASPQQWLQDAHALAHNLFFAMIDGELLEKYK